MKVDVCAGKSPSSNPEPSGCKGNKLLPDATTTMDDRSERALLSLRFSSVRMAFLVCNCRPRIAGSQAEPAGQTNGLKRKKRNKKEKEKKPTRSRLDCGHHLTMQQSAADSADRKNWNIQKISQFFVCFFRGGLWCGLPPENSLSPPSARNNLGADGLQLSASTASLADLKSRLSVIVVKMHASFLLP